MTARLRRLTTHHLMAFVLIVVAPPLGTASVQAQAEGEDGAAAPAAEADSGEEGADSGADAADASTDSDDEGGAETDDDEAEEEFAEVESEKSFGDALGVTLLGTVSVAGAILFFVQSGDSSDLADDAGRLGAGDAQADLQDRADRERAVGITLTVLGAGLLGVATWLWIDRAHERRDREAAVTFVPSFDPAGGAGFVLGGRF